MKNIIHSITKNSFQLQNILKKAEILPKTYIIVYNIMVWTKVKYYIIKKLENQQTWS